MSLAVHSSRQDCSSHESCLNLQSLGESKAKLGKISSVEYLG